MAARPDTPPTDATPVRLKRRRDFLRVAARGKRAARPGLVLQAMAADAPAPRIGFTVTKKVGNAVVRNRAKRRLREAARLAIPALLAEGAMAPGWELVLIGRDATPTRDFRTLLGDLRGALRQAGVIAGDQPSTPRPQAATGSSGASAAMPRGREGGPARDRLMSPVRPDSAQAKRPEAAPAPEAEKKSAAPESSP
ncbi:ribonuclease P protein component [Roseomonas hellenica]|nr:ribonuclease P protein component [Plastoroseomonas hellenica]